MIRRNDALEYHLGDRAGKIEIKSSKPCMTPRELRLTYLPGAVFPAAEISHDPAMAYRYTARANLVGVITNGSAVPGLGDVGPAAAKPIQEGIAVLFKRLADIDVFDLELATRDPAQFIDVVCSLEPTFGGINLKDLSSPEGLDIYDRLLETLNIPVFHEGLYATAVVAIAAMINGLELANKKHDDVRVVVCGAGSVGLGCARLLLSLGVASENLLVYDVHGLLHPKRRDLNPHQALFARDDAASTLAQGLRGADVFLGASVGRVLTPEMIRSMGRFPLVFAMASPEPEISYQDARNARRDVIVATSQGQDPNTIVDLLSFPYIFRGALDVEASRITERMMLSAARALADLAREEVIEEVTRAYGNESFTFGAEYLLPKPIDPRILVRESAAVAAQAIDDGIARKPVTASEHEEHLTVRLGTGREMLRSLILKARQGNQRIVFPEGGHDTILRASSMLMDEGMANPILVGDEEQIQREAEALGLDVGGVTIIDPVRDPRFDVYATEYFKLRCRRGITIDMARARVGDPLYFATMMLHTGTADMMIAGVASHYTQAMKPVLEVIGAAPGVTRISSQHMVLRPKDVYFLADCALNIESDARQLAEIALLAASMVSSLGIEPRLAMLSFSNFGSVDHPYTRKVREATHLVRQYAPQLTIDGELQLAVALDGDVRRRYFPFTTLQMDANVLIFPDLQSGNLALHLLQKLGDAVAVGPVLMGTRRPVHLLQYGASAEDVVNLAAVGVVEAVGRGSS